jgi:hypothetical protein
VEGVLNDPRLLQLATGDNILIALCDLAAGAVVTVGGQTVIVEEDLPLGFKLSARDLEAGEVIVRFGMPIGRATGSIPRGTCVHVHNMASQYIATTNDRGE